jgi:RsmE family RNA methyltransferase
VLKRVLITATSMGVKQLYLLNSYRVEKSYWRSPQLSTENLHDTLCLGLEQGRDTLIPHIHLRPLFKPFVEDELPALCSGKTSIVAHPGNNHLAIQEDEEPGLLAIGPEGGFIPYEIEKLQAAGFQTMSLGPRILRVEAAVPALLARLFGQTLA